MSTSTTASTLRSGVVWVRARLYIIIPLALAAIVGVLGLDRRPFWSDEYYTVGAITSPMKERLFEAPLIPYYVGMRLWSLGGWLVDDWWLRFSSVTAFAATVVLTAVTANRVFAAQSGLAAGVFVAVTPNMGWYAQELRFYSIGALLVTTSTLLFVIAVQGGRGREWWLYALVNCFAALFMPLALVVLMVHAALLAFGSTGRDVWVRWTKAWIVASPFLVAAAWTYTAYGKDLHSWAPQPEIPDLLEWVSLAARSWLLGAVLLGLALVSAGGRLWALAAGVGALTMWLVSWFGASVWLNRSLLLLVPALAIAGSAAFASMNRRWAFAGIGVIGLIMAPAVASQQLRDDPGRFQEPVLRHIRSANPTEEPVTIVVPRDWRYTTIAMALEHEFPDMKSTVVVAGTDPHARPYWSLVEEEPCSGGIPQALDVDAQVTFCP